VRKVDLCDGRAFRAILTIASPLLRFVATHPRSITNANLAWQELALFENCGTEVGYNESVSVAANTRWAV
jgi:hypothetical protein